MTYWKKIVFHFIRYQLTLHDNFHFLKLHLRPHMCLKCIVSEGLQTWIATTNTTSDHLISIVSHAAHMQECLMNISHLYLVKRCCLLCPFLTSPAKRTSRWTQLCHNVYSVKSKFKASVRHDDARTWIYFQHYWPFAQGIHLVSHGEHMGTIKTSAYTNVYHKTKSIYAKLRQQRSSLLKCAKSRAHCAIVKWLL